MPDMTIRKFPDPILRKKMKKVYKITAHDREILAEMAKTMYLSQGVGLAANQVGIDKNMAVIDVGSGLINLVNPDIVKRDGVDMLEEGCLSVPGINIKVRRARSVTVNFLDEDGIARRLHADGLLARAVQHELDHLSGVLILDYMNPVKKMLLKRRIKKGRSKKGAST